MKAKFLYIIFLLILAVIYLTGCSSTQGRTKESNVENIALNSKILGRKLSFKIYLPKEYSSNLKLPVLYFLHGASGSPETMFEELDIKGCSDALITQKKIKPLIIVCPDTLNSLELIGQLSNDTKEPSRDYFEEFLCKELVPYIDSNYNTIKSRASRYIGGISMGGFIAVQTAVHHPEIFGKTGGHSPASWIIDYSDKSFDKWMYSGNSYKDNANIKRLEQKKELINLEIYLDCGKDDNGIIDDTKNLYTALKQRNIKAQLFINEGNHSYDYWKMNFQKYLTFYSS
ncbi:MAG: alpha/beta hydrolase-fold protein [Bacillota bacterium]|nr:alpha/beta hydrolase-fold protein [Bacillota bacterium]